MKFPKSAFIVFEASLVSSLLLIYFGCNKENPSSLVSSNPCGPRNKTHYGSGNLSWIANGGSDTIKINGAYMTSNQFLNDTSAAQGTGGFVKDTTINSKPLCGMIAGFLHIPKSNYLIEQIFIMQFYRRIGSLQIGNYICVPSEDTSSMPYATVTLFFADSLHPPYTIYDVKSGAFTLTGLDTCTQQLEGSFDITMWDPIDTTDQIHLTGGNVKLSYVDSFFIY